MPAALPGPARSADRSADPATAQTHYEAAIVAWTEAGQPIPERLRKALAIARAAAVAPADPIHEGGALEDLPPAPEDEQPLDMSSRKPRA